MNRRTFLHACSASLTTSLLTQAAEPTSLPIIDTHTHFYDPSRPQGVPWPGKGSKLYRTVLPDEFKKLTAPLQVTGTLVVEASPWLEDNQWLLDLAEKEPFLVGIVGRLSPGTDDFRTHLARFTKNPRYRGIRVSADELSKNLAQKAYLDDLRRLLDADLQIDVLGSTNSLIVADKLAQALPKLRIVVDHAANLRIDGKAPPKPWVEGVQALAAHKNVFCKVSALVEITGSPAGQAPTELAHYQPMLDVLWQHLGEDRLMFGSNWPVSEAGASYANLFALVDGYFTGKGKPVREKFFGKNAYAAYKWPKQR